MRDLTHVGPASNGFEGNSLEPDFVVGEIVVALNDVMGADVMSAMSYAFEKVCGISFENNYIFDYPDKFVSALRYTFGSGGDALLRLINTRLAKIMSLENAEELTNWGAPGFVYLINSLKKNSALL